MEELFLLINEIEARALASFWLTPSEIDVPACGDDNHISSNNEHREELVDTGNSNAAEMELFFYQNLSNLKYKEARQMLNEALDGKIQLRPTKDIYMRKADKWSIHIKYKILNTVNP